MSNGTRETQMIEVSSNIIEIPALTLLIKNWLQYATHEWHYTTGMHCIWAINFRHNSRLSRACACVFLYFFFVQFPRRLLVIYNFDSKHPDSHNRLYNNVAMWVISDTKKKTVNEFNFNCWMAIAYWLYTQRKMIDC